MGVQAHIKIQDLIEAGCRVQAGSETYTSHDQDGNPEAWTDHWLEVTLPDGLMLCFNRAPGDSQVWIDANLWGGNRATHLKPLEVLGVAWVES